MRRRVVHPTPGRGASSRPLLHAGIFASIFALVAVIGLFPVRSGDAALDPQLNVNQLSFPSLAASAPLVAQTELQASPQPLTVHAPEVAEGTLLGADNVTNATLQQRALAAENASVEVEDADALQTARVAMYRNYEIEPGDTITSIAAKFDLDPNYITWNNPNLENPSRLSPGVQVIIPYVPGIVHAVEFEETLTDIARRYDAETQDILDFAANDLPDPNLLVANKFIFVPYGRIVPRPAPSIRPGAATVPPPQTGEWLWPLGIAGTLTSRWVPWHPLGIDIALPTGNEVLASKGGVVIFAGGDPWVGYGYHIKVEHEGGWESTYAHLREIPEGMTNGTVVNQGDFLAYSGSTGNSTGPHLHFETRYYGEPLDPMDQLLP